MAPGHTQRMRDMRVGAETMIKTDTIRLLNEVCEGEIGL